MVCANTAFTPTVRRKVDLPDMFDPVISTPCGAGKRDRIWHRIVDKGMAQIGQHGRHLWRHESRTDPLRGACAEGRNRNRRVDVADGFDELHEMGAARAQLPAGEVERVDVHEQLDVDVLDEGADEIG
jgi:hypothetical protein